MASLDERLTRLEALVAQLVEAVGGTSTGPAGAPVDVHQIGADDLAALARKLDRFGEQLQPDEKATLLAVLGAAAVKFDEAAASTEESVALPDGVRVFTQGPLDRVGLGDALIALGSVDRGPAATVGGGIDEVADSVNVGGDIACVHGDWTKDLGSLAIDEAGKWATGPDLGGLTRVGVPDLGGRFAVGGFESAPSHKVAPDEDGDAYPQHPDR